MTCSHRVWHFDKEITLQGAKAVFTLQKTLLVHSPPALSELWATSHHQDFKHHAWVALSNALTALSFVLAERFRCLGILVFGFFASVWFGFWLFHKIHSYTYLSHNQQDKYTRISLAKSSSCLDFHPNVGIKTACETSPASHTFYGLTNSPYPTAARS